MLSSTKRSTVKGIYPEPGRSAIITVFREASSWSAFRTINYYPEFDLDKTIEQPESPVYFTGETVSQTTSTELQKELSLTLTDPASHV